MRRSITLLSIVLMTACAGMTGGIPGNRTMESFKGKNRAELETKIGSAPKKILPGNDGGQILIWVTSQIDFDEPFTSNPQYGTLPNEDKKDSVTITELHVWVDKAGTITDYNLDTYQEN